MKLTHFWILLAFIQVGLAQSPDFFENSFTDEMTDQVKFQTYLDSANKYLYRDVRITEIALAKCQEMLNQGIPLPDSLRAEFIIESIYLKHSLAKPVEAYQVIVDSEALLDSMQLPNHQRGTYIYIKSFTFMAIGDLEAAQKSYYEGLQMAKANKDTNSVISFLYSLGQLYNDEGDYDAAIDCFEQVEAYHKVSETRPSTVVLVRMEWSESYFLNQQKERAIEELKKAYQISKDYNLQILRADVLISFGNIYIEENQIDLAQQTYDTLVKVSQIVQDPNITYNRQKFRANLFQAQKLYPQALAIYKDLLEQSDSTNLDRLIFLNRKLHELSSEMGDYEGAYEYLLAHNSVMQQREEDEKKQQTNYLKIKFESEQKEKENEILTVEILKNKAESQLLYLWLALSFLVLVILFGALYQKRRYSKTLENEVSSRTVHLRKSYELLDKSNTELNEFNRILSHDLKEPLRSIISFSQLAQQEVEDNDNVQEYLQFVISGGEQLEELINSINIFQRANSVDIYEITEIYPQTLLNEILLDLQKVFPHKNVQLNCNSNPLILSSPATLRSVFHTVIDNAVKYNQQEVVSINVSYYSKDQIHYFEIEDNGIGIPAQYHSKIFSMFKRLHSRKKYKGSGMGLSIAKKLINRIGGDIALLQSQENEGSTFLIHFPESVQTLQG